MTGAIVATSIVFFPAAPLFLFMHGKDISIPKGTEITAYVNGNTPLDANKFEGSASPTQAVAADAKNANAEISSNPAGGDIEIDGKFIGNTPSTIPLPVGDHTIKVSKSGYLVWQRAISLTGGTIKISAELEPVPSAPQN